MTARAYGSSIFKMFPRPSHDTINVLGSFQKSKAFRKCDLTDDIKGEHLNPGAEITSLARLHKSSIELLEEDTHGRVDILFKGNQIAHRVDACDRPFQLTMQLFILRGEHAGQHFAL